jgi:hypothetical protein
MGQSAQEKPGVEVLINCYETTVRTVLESEFLLGIFASNCFEFATRTVAINNVDDRSSAAAAAERLVASGTIDRYFFVADHADAALAAVGLSTQALGRIAHYSNWAFVGMHLAREPYLLHWDPEVTLLEPHDWISPSLAAFEREPLALCANPLWNPHRHSMETIRREALCETPDFFVGYGFSDQVYLIRTAEMQRSVYDYSHPESLRYPLAHIAPIFEQRVDSYMRRNHRLRLTYRHAGYNHPAELEGRHYPNTTFLESSRKHLQRIQLGAYRKFAAARSETKVLDRLQLR